MINKLKEILETDGRAILLFDGYKNITRLFIARYTNDETNEEQFFVYDGYGDTIQDVCRFNTLEEVIDETGDNFKIYAEVK